MTELALSEILLESTKEADDYYLHDADTAAAGQAAESSLPLLARIGGLAVHESHNILAAFKQSAVRHENRIMWLKTSHAIVLDTLPPALRAFIEDWNRRRAAGEQAPIPF